MTPRLTRVAFVILLLIVATTLVVNLPPLEEVGKTPSSEFVTFSMDHGETEIHRKLKDARHAELRGDSLRRKDSSDADGYYRDSLYYLERAQRLARRRGSGSYIDDLIEESQVRVHRKIARTRRQNQ